MARIALILTLVAALTTAPVLAAGVMNEQQARAAAVKILQGDPYGQTPAAVMRNMQDAQLIKAAPDQTINQCVVEEGSVGNDDDLEPFGFPNAHKIGDAWMEQRLP